MRASKVPADVRTKSKDMTSSAKAEGNRVLIAISGRNRLNRNVIFNFFFNDAGVESTSRLNERNPDICPCGLLFGATLAPSPLPRWHGVGPVHSREVPLPLTRDYFENLLRATPARQWRLLISSIVLGLPRRLCPRRRPKSLRWCAEWVYHT